MPPPYEGGCLCGDIRYRLIDEPLTLYACHCTDCQRQSGTAFGLSMVVLQGALELRRGAPVEYTGSMSDGREKNVSFCGRCGTRVWGKPARYPQIVILRPGTLDDTSWLRPVGHIWTRSAQPWVPIPADTANFEGQPDDPLVMIEAWRKRNA